MTLVPIVGGVIIASITEATFNWTGFLSAMFSNITFQSRCVRALCDYEGVAVIGFVVWREMSVRSCSGFLSAMFSNITSQSRRGCSGLSHVSGLLTRCVHILS